MAKPNGAGDLKDRIKFQRMGVGDDGYGNETTVFADMSPVLERPAKVTPTRGDEAVQAGRLAGKGAYDIWMRNEAAVRAITTADRAVDVRDASRVFNIRFGPEDMDGDGKWLFLQAELGVAT